MVWELVRAEASARSGAGQGNETELAMVARWPKEEIASVRCILRNLLELALEIQEVTDYMRLVEIYSNESLQLVRMLKKEGSDHSQLERYFMGMIERSVKDPRSGNGESGHRTGDESL